MLRTAGATPLAVLNVECEEGDISTELRVTVVRHGRETPWGCPQAVGHACRHLESNQESRAYETLLSP